ncbi:hypothetical protein Tco_1315153 [Tanacetum coccineum]
MGMDWLSKRKFVIVCHEKVVRILLEGDEILQVHGERTLGAAKALMNAKIDEPRISVITVVRDFTDVFPEDFSMATMTTSDALSIKERVKSRRVRGMILAAQSEAFKQENVLWVGMVAMGFEYCLASSSRWTKRTYDSDFRRYNGGMCIDFGGSYHLSIWCAPFESLYRRKCRSLVLWAEIRESSLPGLELSTKKRTDRNGSGHTMGQHTSYVTKQQHQQQEWDAWEEETVIDEDEVIPEDETPELITEFQNVDKRVPTIFDRARMEATLNDMLIWESRQEDIRRSIPKALVFYGPQRNPNEPPRYLYNKDLFFLKDGNTKEKKYILSLHKIHAELFPEADLKEKMNRWV